MKKLKLLWVFFLYFLASIHASAQNATGTAASIQDGNHKEENLSVLNQWITWNNPGSLLITHLNKQAFDLYARRDSEIDDLKTLEDWQKRQDLVNEKLKKIVGPFPDRTPLNPRITGIVKKDGYRVEKTIFESTPGNYVTGCLFVPDMIDDKAPAVLNVIGHNQEAFRAELYQIVILNLVRKGIVVFAIDPPGQGEHVQYFDPSLNFSSVGYTVLEHCYLGNQCFLTGSSAAYYFIWEGIRAIDYLLTLEYVDPGRIGVTGFSGGGTVASYLGAFDDRIKVSVPCSWATASRRQLETKGAQDAEAELYHSAAEGITFEDLLEVRAPKPTLLTFVSRDEYLSLQGAREAFNEAKKAYDAFGMGDNIVMIEDDSRHWLTPKIREGIYSFFMKHFSLHGDPSEQKITILPVNELTVTATGQISTSLGGKFIFDANRTRTLELWDQLEKSRSVPDMHLNNVQKKGRELSGYLPPEDVPEPFINGRYQRNGYAVEKLAISGEGDYVIPFLLFLPDSVSGSNPALIYLHPLGKATEAKPGGEIEKLVREGFIVAAPDLLGTGETKNTATRDLAPGYTSVLIARSIPGIQAGDISRIMKYLVNRDDVDRSCTVAVGRDEMCIPLIHAAAFDTSIKNVVLIGSQVSYRTISMNRFYKIGIIKRENGSTHHPIEIDFSWGVPGVMTVYDLPDLIACVAPRKVIFMGLKDQMLEPASSELIDEEFSFPRYIYSLNNAQGNIKITSSREDPVSIIASLFR